MVTFIGEEKKTHRLITPWHTFNHAFENRKGEIGFPVRAICEISGFEGTGKSTFAYCLASYIANEVKNGAIAFADIEEHFDTEFTRIILENVRFTGNFHIVPGKTDGHKVDNLVKLMKEENYPVGILDSVGAISPIAEIEGKAEDANWGRRAKLVNAHLRRIIHVFAYKNTPSILLYTNHVHPRMGGFGYVTPGGVAKEFLTTSQFRLTKKEKQDDGSFLIGGKVTKNTFGYEQRVFYLFNLAGWGIHPGLTAVYDCIMLGIANKDKTIKMNDKSYGYMKNMLKSPEDEELFEPFMKALEEWK